MLLHGAEHLHLVVVQSDRAVCRHMPAPETVEQHVEVGRVGGEERQAVGAGIGSIEGEYFYECRGEERKDEVSTIPTLFQSPH